MFELVVIVAIIGLAAAMALPRSFAFLSMDNTQRTLQRAVSELSDLALGGRELRMRVDLANGRADRGRIVIELLTRGDAAEEQQFLLAAPAPEFLWKPVATRYRIEGSSWQLEPEIVYFHSDGTCTPARITLMGSRDDENETMLLTVTGFLFQPEEKLF
jgi:hypothetical protein